MRKMVVALVAAVVVLALAPSVGADTAESTDTVGSTDQQQAQPDQQTITGTLRYERDDEQVFVEGARVTVEGEGGFSETVESDAEGRFEVAVPGPGSYTVTLDEDSLPGDVGLTNDRPSLTIQLRPGRTTAPALFPLGIGGEGTRNVASTYERAVRLTIQGLRFGLIIAMAAVGLSLVFGTTRLTNFAHGEMVTFGALMAYLFNVTLGWDMIPAALVAIGISVIAGSSFDRFFWRPLRNRGTSLVSMLVISIGASLFFRYIFNFQFGGRNRTYNQFLEQDPMEWGPIRIVPRDLTSMVLSVVVLVAVALFLERTRMGKATRAVADNRDLAESSGIDVQRVINFVWAAGGGLAALGGILQGLSEGVNWQMGWTMLLLMFAGVTLGGLGTAYGALVGSVVVGVVHELSTLWIPSEFKTVTALAILVLILLVRPQGILGQAERVG
ncbi:MAG TPA: branched-chain amino acid ABC transporter permease [Acidimicrobiales bacterium]